MSSAAVHENISAPSAGPAAAQGPAGQPNAASIASPALGKQAATATPGGQQDWAIYNQYASLIGGATWCLWMVMIFCTIALMKRYSKKSKNAKSAVFVAPGEEEEQIEYVQRGYRQTNAGKFVWHFWTKFMVQLCFVELGFFIVTLQFGGKYLWGPEQETFEKQAFGYLLTLFICNSTLLMLVLYRWDLKISTMEPCDLFSADHVQIKPRHRTKVGGGHHGWLNSSRRAAFTSVSGRPPLPEARLLPVEHDCEVSYIEYGCIRCLFQPETGCFNAPPAPCCDPEECKQSLELGGLSNIEIGRRMMTTGPNVINVPTPTPGAALLEEIMTPVMVYQLTCVMIYFGFAWGLPFFWICSNMMVSMYSVFAVTLPQSRKIGEMARNDTQCAVMRGGNWEVKDAAEIVPGDVVALYGGQAASCDVVLCAGQAVVSEAMLTGEPKPIVKFAYDYEGEAAMRARPWIASDSAGNVKKHVIHAGCPITQALGVRSSQIGLRVPGSDDSDEACVGVVLSTGAQTAKGGLVRMVLFPTPIEDVFDKQLTLVFLWVFIFCVILASSIAFYDFGHWSITAFSMMAFLAQCISPNLHASLRLAQVLNTQRLATKGVNVVEPEILCKAGKVHVMCFDKTGTITEEHLDLQGIIPLDDINNHMLSNPEASLPMARYHPDQLGSWTKTLSKDLQVGIGCCHTLSELTNNQGKKELLGNQVEMKMFEASGWYMDSRTEYSNANPFAKVKNVSIMRQMAFDQGSQTSGVVVRMPNGQQKVIIKGSFEKLCALTTSGRAHSALEEHVRELSAQQYYLITIGVKHVEADVDVTKVPREDLESGIQLVGLLLFKNDVKKDSAQAIRELKEGSTRVVMITGDSVEAGLGIARAVDILPAKDHARQNSTAAPSSYQPSDTDSSDSEGARLLNSANQMPRPHVIPGVRIYQGDLVKSNNQWSKEGQMEVIWRDVDASHAPLLQTQDLMALDPSTVELAISMPAFRKLSVSGNMMFELAPLVRVYGRMRPKDKAMAVKLLQRHNLVVGMCGDGGNDTAALRAAHFGYALSDADASLVAPVSSKDPSLLRLNDTLCSARCCLATCLSIFMWSAMVGATYPIFKIVNVWTNGNMLAETAGVYMEYAIETALPFFMAYAAALPKLTGYRPTQRLLGLNVGLRTVLPVMVWIFCLLITRMVLAAFPWFEQFNARDMHMKRRDQYTVRSDAYQMEIDVFRMFCFYTVMSLWYSRGESVRQPLRKNWLLISWAACTIAFMFFLILQQNTTIGCFFRFNCDSQTTLGLKNDPGATFFGPSLNFPVAGECVYGPQIGHWVEKNGQSYTFPDGTNNCHIGDASYDQSLWGPNSKTGTSCVGPNNCLPWDGKVFAIVSMVATCAIAIGGALAIASVRLRWKRQFHRL